MRWLGTWLRRWTARHRARRRAIRHLAIVTQALFTGSTQAYTLTEDLPREAGSTTIRWDD